MNIYTIGHSNHSWENFKELLTDNGIELLVDVRSRPVSRFAPFSNERTFPTLLETVGIQYRFMGDTLGGRPDNPKFYDAEGKPDYQKMRRSWNFQSGLADLLNVSGDLVAVIMCSEGDPAKCHRRLLIGAALEEKHARLFHIMRNGVVTSEDELGGMQAEMDI